MFVKGSQWQLLSTLYLLENSRGGFLKNLNSHQAVEPFPKAGLDMDQLPIEICPDESESVFIKFSTLRGLHQFM